MTSLLLDSDDSISGYLERVELGEGLSEKWLQKTLFEHPRLLPLDRIDLGAGEFIPLCRELPLPKVGGQVYLDILGVTRQGHLVLVECKLWRNPQARREVIAQIIEYAALLRRWSYADLTARLNAKFGKTGRNPIFEHSSGFLQGVSEADFVDAVSRSLRTGDFHLIIAGDGIRDDMSAIGEHMTGQGARLALVEFQMWTDANGKRLLVPHIPFKTEVLRQRIITDMEGAPVLLEEDGAQRDTFNEGPKEAAPEQSARRAANREFWQRYIDRAVFDHPDQPSPRHGGNNWVKIPMPWPGKNLNLYRFEGGGGHIGVALVVEKPEIVIPTLAVDADVIREETGLPDLRFHNLGAPTVAETIGFTRPIRDFATQDEILDWLVDVGNRLVSALRPRLVEVASTMER